MKLSDETVIAVTLQKDDKGQDIMQVQFARPDGNAGSIVFYDFDYKDFLNDVREHFNKEED